jgi:hypothetical protein
MPKRRVRMRRINKALAALGLCGAFGAAQAQPPLVPLTTNDYLAMRARSGPAVLMLAACEPAAKAPSLEALARAGVKATVFVSGKAIESSPELIRLLRRRPDLFEVGNLGQTCAARQGALGDVQGDARAGKPESRDRVAALLALGKSMLDGSKSIEAALGRKARFFAFGLDFDHSAADPFEQSRLAAGLAAYLKAPGPASRYDALAGAKAGFKARVVLVKLDGPQGGPLNGPGSYAASSIEAGLRQKGAALWSRKASEAWDPRKRAALAREIGAGSAR